MTEIKPGLNPLDYADRAQTIPQIAENLEKYHVHLALRYNQIRNIAIIERHHPGPACLIYEAVDSLRECVKKLNLAIKCQEAEEWKKSNE